MAIFRRVVDFLPAGTDLMVSVNPSGDIDHEKQKLLITDLRTEAANSGAYVGLHLEEPLEIDFSISKSGNLSRDLKSCKCTSLALPNQQFKSLNNAYQKISTIFEQDRASQGGKVYERIYFQDDDGVWKLIDILRERIYAPYQPEFDEHIRIRTETISGYVKPISQSAPLFTFEIQQKDELVNILFSQTGDLQGKVEELSALLEKSKLTAYRQKVDEFRKRLQNDYPESNGKDSWQEWIYKNNWLFGIHYGNSIGHPQVGFRSVLDYLFPTPDGFVDILEIKRPSHEVIKEDKSHPGAYKWSSEVNSAVGQVVNYLHEIELHQLEIAKKLKQEFGIELSTIKPRAFILVGESNKWSDVEREAFRRLNHSLHGIEILTYTDLLCRAENLIKVYSD